MTIVAVTLGLLTVTATAALADEWEQKFLAYKGGNRPIIVEPEEAQFSTAHYGNRENGKQIQLGCLWRNDFNGDRIQARNLQLWVGGGPDFGRAMNVSATFQSGQVVEFEELSYARGSYWGWLPLEFVEAATVEESVVIAHAQSDFRFAVQLEGFAEIFSGIKCFGGETKSIEVTK